jgi:hypothetical protein
MVEFTPDGAHVVSGYGEASRLMLHDARTGTLVLDTQALMKPSPAYGAATGVPRIAVGRASGELEIFDLPAGSRRVLQVSKEPVIAARLSEDGTRVAACALDEVVRLYDAGTGRLVYEVPHAALPFSVAMEGDLLVTCSEDQTTRFFDLATGAPRAVLQGNAEPEEVLRREYWEVLGEDPVAFHRRRSPVPMAHFQDSLEETVILRDGLVVARGRTLPDFLYVLKHHDAPGPRRLPRARPVPEALDTLAHEHALPWRPCAQPCSSPPCCSWGRRSSLRRSAPGMTAHLPRLRRQTTHVR